MKSLNHIAFTILIALALPGCASVKETVTDTYYGVKDYASSALPDRIPGTANKADKLVDKNTCPEVEMIDDLASYYDFGGGSGGENNLVSGVNMTKGNTTCAFGPKSVAVDTQIIFNGRVGAKGKSMGNSPVYSYPYFVAIMAPGGKILAKEVFAAPLNYSSGDTQGHIESFRQIIPSYSQENAGKHKIAIGFQLTKEQLDYNRALIKRREKEQKAILMQQNALLQQKTVTTAPNGQILQTTTTTMPAGAPAAMAPVDPLDAGPLILTPPDDGKKKMND